MAIISGPITIQACPNIQIQDKGYVMASGFVLAQDVMIWRVGAS